MIPITDNLELVSATCRNHALKVYDDSWGPLFLYGQEYGPTMLIRAGSIDQAYEIAIDESPTIPPEDVPEAYGQDDAFSDWLCERFDIEKIGGSKGWRHVCDFVREWLPVWFDIKRREWNETGEWPELIEGYQFQSNSSGTGIVYVGHHEWIRQVDRDLLIAHEVKIVLRDREKAERKKKAIFSI